MSDRSLITERSKKRKKAIETRNQTPPPLPPKPSLLPPPLPAKEKKKTPIARKKLQTRLENVKKELKQAGYNTPKKQKILEFAGERDLMSGNFSDVYPYIEDEMVHISSSTTPTNLAKKIKEKLKEPKSSTLVLGYSYGDKAGDYTEGGHANALEINPSKKTYRLIEPNKSDTAQMEPKVREAITKIEEKGIKLKREKRVNLNCNPNQNCLDISTVVHKKDTPKREKTLEKLKTNKSMLKHIDYAHKLTTSTSTSPASYNIAKELKKEASIPTFNTMIKAKKAAQKK